MDLYRLAERAMGMTDAVWARHTNPWSVWTRFTCLPLIVLAIWSRVWLGWWCLIPLIAALAWTWWNPRAFPAPAEPSGWAHDGVMGERLWLARKTRPVPAHHVAPANALSAMSALGGLALAWGLIDLDLWWTALGLIVTVGAKVWFVDRMAWLYAEMTR